MLLGALAVAVIVAAVFAYLFLLLVAVGGWVLTANRGQLGRMAQQAAIWARRALPCSSR